MSYTRYKLPDEFTRDYVVAALWSTMDNADDSGGEPLDQNYGVDDIADETVEDMIADCEEFQEKNADDLARVADVSHGGHDFWLTRCGHGAGFWSREYGQPEEVKDALDRLTEASKKFGDCDLYVGDDGKIYAGHTRSAAARRERRQQHLTRMTAPHGRCIGRTCVEHAANKRVPSCKKVRHRRER